MDLWTIALSVMVMTGLGILLSVTLALANKRLYVYEDPSIDAVEGLLPNANCGACGFPGCRNFAEQVVGGKITPGQCTVSTPDAREEIAGLLGVSAGAGIKRVARLACAGGTNVARQRAVYQGLPTCRAANLVAGGGKGCAWGCLGLSDCATVCAFGAITMDPHGLPVVDLDRCTACGDCVDICPRRLFSLESVEQHLFVRCKNEAFGELAEQECEVACTACGRCAADAPSELIVMKNNLAVISGERLGEQSFQAIQRCPTGAIVWLDGGTIVKGRAAKKIVRTTAL